MCEVGARCPACGTDLAPYETYCSRLMDRTHRHEYSCECGAKVTLTSPAPGLVMTRQDAEVQP